MVNIAWVICMIATESLSKIKTNNVFNTIGSLRKAVLSEEQEDKSKWLNELIKLFWPKLSTILEEKTLSMIEPILTSKLHGIKVKNVNLGTKTPSISSIKVSGDNTHILIDAYVLYDGDMQLNLSYGKMQAGLKNLQFGASIRLMLRNLLHKPPYAQAIYLCLLSPPNIDFDLTDLASLGELPFISEVVKNSVVNTISSYMLLPNRLVFELMPGELEEFCSIAGVVRVCVKEGRELPLSDVGWTNCFRGSIDAYAEVIIGANEFRTKIIRHRNPQWCEVFEGEIEDPNVQKLLINIYDKDVVTADDLLGSISFSLDHLRTIKMCSGWYPIGNAVDGFVWLRLDWLNLYSDFEFLKDTMKFNTEYMKTCSINAGELSSAVILMKVVEAKALYKVRSRKNLAPKAYCVLSMISGRRKLIKQTHISPESNNPVWNTYFVLPFNGFGNSITLQVKDQGDSKKQCLGIVSIPISKLCSTEFMKTHKYQLQRSVSDDAKIIFKASVRILNPGTHIFPNS